MTDELETRLEAWVESVLKVDVEELELIPGGASRRSYRVLMADGKNAFLRVDTGEGPLSGTEMDLAREKQFIDPVAQTGFPVPEILAYSAELNALLMQHVAGFTSYQKVLEPEAQRRVEQSLIDVIGQLHALEIQKLGLPDCQNRKTVGEATMAALSMWQGLYDNNVALKDPAISFALHWLKHNIPDQDHPSVLVHGDVGPGNFLFTEQGNITALIDWELAHIGHPLEDLACVLCRSLGVTFGSGPQLLADYAAVSGKPVNRSSLDYAIILVLTEWSVAINMALSRPTVNQDVAMLFLWGHVNRYALLAQLASFFGESIPNISQPDKLSMEWSFIPDYVENSLLETILPKTEDTFIAHRLNALIQLQKVQSSLLAYGPETFCREEVHWASKLCGTDYTDYAAARQAIIERANSAAAEGDKDFLEYLLSRAAIERSILKRALGPMADRQIEY